MKLDAFENQVVLITGAAGGFGSLLAEEMGRRGARLVLGDRDAGKLTAVEQALRGEGIAVHAQPCDVSREAEVRQLVLAAMSTFGRLDIAVNNAGLATPPKALTETTEEEMDLLFAVNTKGVLFGMKHQIPVMAAAGGGVVLNVASMAGLGGAPKLAAYAASKHAVVGLTRTAAVEYARKGVRVNAICPFYTTTPMVTDSELASQQDLLSSGSPMKRLARPEEVVAVMLMMCSPANTYMTGQAVAVDGGVSAY